MQRIVQRSAGYPLPQHCATFDILTLVLDTDAAILRKTAASVIAQDAPVWRWLICDNGSTNRSTLKVLRELDNLPNVLVETFAQNFGIVEGHRRGLKLCTAEYVAFLDHDDLLTPDALRIVACTVDRHQRPEYLYSDEDKCDAHERHFAPLLKPGASPALLSDTAYTCHLSVASRQQLATCGAFTDPSVEGTQDWDMALRLFESKCTIVHIPEILYSWRATLGSTSLALSSKSYVLDAQRSCLQQHLRRRDLADRFEVLSSPMLPAPDGRWWMSRLSVAPQPTVEVFVPDEQTAGAVNRTTDYSNFHVRVASGEQPDIAHSELVAMVPAACDLQPGWLWEAVGLFELVPDAAVVCAAMPSDNQGSNHFQPCRRDVATASEPWVARVAPGGSRIVATPFFTALPFHTGSESSDGGLCAAG